MAQYLSEVTLDAVESVQQTADAFVPLLSKPEEITPAVEVRSYPLIEL